MIAEALTGAGVSDIPDAGRMLGLMKSLNRQLAFDLDQADRVNFGFPARCGVLPDALAILVFDAAFQHGVPYAVAMLQRALGLDANGQQGLPTLEAIKSRTAVVDGVATLCIAFQAQRLLHMMQEPSWETNAQRCALRLCMMMSISAHLEKRRPGNVV
jgi:lysozyme family protein